MKKQRYKIIALVLLVIVWAVSWRLLFKVPKAPPAAAPKATPSKASQSDTLLKTRFHRVRSEMDALYHYRIKPTPFDAHANPFRIPGMSNGSVDLAASSGKRDVKGASAESASNEPPPTENADTILKRAVAAMRMGGVVTMNGTIQFTVDGQLHKEGDVFTAKLPSASAPAKSVLIRVKHLSTTAVTLALEESEAGGAEIRIRLN